ncbi:unnamed protein product [Prorocentrum cordatum]|uniref:Uncharacterized protein n=1 Tax=Prorocentrum cordatum TaxID=2364126 RepID=A0ABN9RPU7_9DINO|nr:unnamed protein product [Polarella glacialis]
MQKEKAVYVDGAPWMENLPEGKDSKKDFEIDDVVQAPEPEDDPEAARLKTISDPDQWALATTPAERLQFTVTASKGGTLPRPAADTAGPPSGSHPRTDALEDGTGQLALTQGSVPTSASRLGRFAGLSPKRGAGLGQERPAGRPGAAPGRLVACRRTAST